MAGIKETKEMLVAANEVGILAVKQLRDGIQYQDFEAFYQAFTANPDFRGKVLAAWESKEQIPTEVADLGLFEVIELGQTQLSYVPKLVAAMKG